jgi:hypothetical protein
MTYVGSARKALAILADHVSRGRGPSRRRARLAASRGGKRSLRRFTGPSCRDPRPRRLRRGWTYQARKAATITAAATTTRTTVEAATTTSDLSVLLERRKHVAQSTGDQRRETSRGAGLRPGAVAFFGYLDRGWRSRSAWDPLPC